MSGVYADVWRWASGSARRPVCVVLYAVWPGNHNQRERYRIRIDHDGLRCCYCYNYCKPRGKPVLMDAGASHTAGRYTEVPFRARLAYYIIISYKYYVSTAWECILACNMWSNSHIIVTAIFIRFIRHQTLNFATRNTYIAIAIELRRELLIIKRKSAADEY